MKSSSILWDLLRSSYCEYTVHALLSDSLLRDSHKVSPFQSRWMGTIVYRVTCDEMLAKDLWFMLACLGLAKMFYSGTIFCNFWPCLHARSLWRDAVLACTWRMPRSMFFTMIECWRDALLACNWCMTLNLIIRMFQSGRDALTIGLYFAFDLLHYTKSMKFWRDAFTNDLYISQFLTS